MMASTPQVIVPRAPPGDDGDGARPGPGPPGPGGRRPTHWSSMPAGAEGGLGLPGPGAALADQRGLLVAGHAGDRPAARRGSRAGPTAPDESTMVGQQRLGDAQRGRGSRRLQPDAVGVDEPGHPGVGGVGDVEPAARQGPGHPGVHRAEGQLAPLRPGAVRVGQVEQGGHLGGRGVGGHPDPLGLELQAGADGAQVLPPEARARPARRWPGPRRWSTPAGWRCPPRRTGPPVGQARRGHLDHGVGHGDGVELDQPGERGVGQHRHVVDVLDGAVGADHRPPHPGGADVDDQDAHGQGTGPNGAVEARACPG